MIAEEIKKRFYEDGKFEIVKDKADIIDCCRATYGNGLVIMSEEDILELRKGNALFYDDGEYGTFVILSTSNNA